MSKISEKERAIGERIAQARVETGGMTQPELADLIGVSPRSIQAYESGEVIPYRYFRQLERVLDRPMAWFLHGDGALVERDEQHDEVMSALTEIRSMLESLGAKRPRARRA